MTTAGPITTTGKFTTNENKVTMYKWYHVVCSFFVIVKCQPSRLKMNETKKRDHLSNQPLKHKQRSWKLMINDTKGRNNEGSRQLPKAAKVSKRPRRSLKKPEASHASQARLDMCSRRFYINDRKQEDTSLGQDTCWIWLITRKQVFPFNQTRSFWLLILLTLQCCFF